MKSPVSSPKPEPGGRRFGYCGVAWAGFAREQPMAWCEQNRVDFVFGPERNARLIDEIDVELANAEEEVLRTRAGPRAASRTFATRRSTVGRAGGWWRP